MLTARIIQSNDRSTNPQRHIHNLPNLLGVCLPQRPTINSKILRECIHPPSGYQSMPHNDAIPRRDVFLHPKVLTAMCHQCIDLAEGVCVEEEVETFSCREGAFGVLLLDAGGSAAQEGLGLCCG